MWVRGLRGNNATCLALGQLSVTSPLSISKLGPSGADSWVSGFVYVLGPCEAGSFSCHHNPHRFFQSEVLRLYFPVLEPWVSQSILLPSCSSRCIYTQIWDLMLHQPQPYLPRCFSYLLAAHPLCPICLSLPLLPVWLNVSLTP